MTMLRRAGSGRAAGPFALISAYLRGDLEALDALVDDDDASELLVMVTEILTGALLRLVSADELSRQVTAKAGSLHRKPV